MLHSLAPMCRYLVGESQSLDPVVPRLLKTSEFFIQVVYVIITLHVIVLVEVVLCNIIFHTRQKDKRPSM